VSTESASLVQNEHLFGIALSFSRVSGCT